MRTLSAQWLLLNETQTPVAIDPDQVEPTHVQ